MAASTVDLVVASIFTVCVMGTGTIGATKIQNSIARNAASLAETVSRTQAIQTATLAELAVNHLPLQVVESSVFYERANGEKCYLVVHGKAVPNTRYSQ